MATDTEISNAISKFIDKPHAIGNPARGWDCLNSMLDFYRGLNAGVPESFEGYTEQNYPELWEKDSDKCREALERFVQSLGRDVGINFIVRGDLLIFKTTELPAFPAIYLGNGHMMLVIKEGVKVVPLRFFERQLIGARRLIP